MNQCCKNTYAAAIAEVILVIRNNNILNVNQIIAMLEFALRELDKNELHN